MTAVLLTLNHVAFPRPISYAEHCALDHLLAEVMTLEESDIHVHPLKSAKKQQLREQELRVILLKRLRKSWNKDLNNRYHEWVNWYYKYGKHKRG